MLVGWSVRWSVGPFVPISLRKLVTSQMLRAWGLVTTLFQYEPQIYEEFIGVRRGVSKGVEDGRRLPILRAGYP
jgi:hypothetical protein